MFITLPPKPRLRDGFTAWWEAAVSRFMRWSSHRWCSGITPPTPFAIDPEEPGGLPLPWTEGSTPWHWKDCQNFGVAAGSSVRYCAWCRHPQKEHCHCGACFNHQAAVCGPGYCSSHAVDAHEGCC